MENADTNSRSSQDSPASANGHPDLESVVDVGVKDIAQNDTSSPESQNKPLSTQRESNNTLSKLNAQRGIPKSIDSEKAVLGSILINNNLYNEVFSKLEISDFYDSRHQLIADAMTSYRLEKGEAAIDIITLATLLSDAGKLKAAGGVSYLNEIINSIPTVINYKYYVEIVKEKSQLRRVIGHCEQAVGSCIQNSPSEVVIEKLFQNLYELSSGEYQEYQVIGSGMDETVGIIEDTIEGKASALSLSSGYSSIDELIGGLQGSNLIIVGGRTGMGKTAFALSMLKNIASDHVGKAEKIPVGFFSLEMSRHEICTRLLSLTTNIEAHKFRKKEGLNWERVVAGSDELRELPIFIDDTPGITISELRLKARRMTQKDKVRVIIVDYLQLITSAEPNIMREQQISNISKQLKNLARELKIPIITLTQLNRSAEMREDKVPKLSDIRESGAIEQDADLVMFIHRPSYDKPKDEVGTDDDDDNTAKIYLSKNRHGPTGVVTLSFDSRFMRFEEHFKQAN